MKQQQHHQQLNQPSLHQHHHHLYHQNIVLIHNIHPSLPHQHNSSPHILSNAVVHVSSIDDTPCMKTLDHPDRWLCIDCNTSKSIRICLICGSCLCSAHLQPHHRLHTDHHLFMYLNTEDKQVFCLTCQCRVMNDSRQGDIAFLRSRAEQIQSYRLAPRTTRSGLVISKLRSESSIDRDIFRADRCCCC